MLGIYCRISRDKEEGKDRSIKEQRLSGEALAKKLDMSFQVFIDEGVSGTWELEDRPAFFELIKDLTNKKGNITTIYAYDASRLYRSDKTRLQFLSAVKKKEIDIYFENGKFDWSDPYMDFMGKVLSASDVLHVDVTKLKVKATLKRNAQEGKAHAKVCPIGFTKDEKGYLVVDEEEKLVVEKIYKMCLEGLGTTTIKHWLNDNNIPTKYNKLSGVIRQYAYTTRITFDENGQEIKKRTKVIGNDGKPKVKKIIEKSNVRWSDKTVQDILKNPIYKGKRKWGEEYFECPAIFDEIYWQQIQDQYQANVKKGSRGKKVDHQYMLRGLIRCAVCGSNYYGRRRTPLGITEKTRTDSTGKTRKDRNYYTCISKRDRVTNCGNKNILLEPFEDFIWNRFFKDNTLTELVKNHFQNHDNEGKIKELEAGVKSLNNILISLDDDKKRGVKLIIKDLITETEFSTEKARIELEQKDIRIELANFAEQLQSFKDLGKKLKTINNDLKALKNISYIDKREIVHKYIKDISIIYIEPWFSIAINFDIRGLPLEIYMMDVNYDFAINTDREIFIPLSDKLKGKDIAKGEWQEIREGMDQLMTTAVNRKFNGKL